MEPAVFSLKNYFFEKVQLDFSKIKSNSFNLDINPSGKFFQKSGTFELTFEFSANESENNETVIFVLCRAEFYFKNVATFKDIPAYFYTNSIAILFPYIRAFVSTLTLQANRAPIIIPIMNLASLEATLRSNTDSCE
jgi:preprotein translocase subunit SecB